MSSSDVHIVLDNLDEGILHLGNGLVTYVNPVFRRLLGVGNNNIIGTKCSELPLYHLQSKVQFFSLAEESLRDNKKREETLLSTGKSLISSTLILIKIVDGTVVKAKFLPTSDTHLYLIVSQPAPGSQEGNLKSLNLILKILLAPLQLTRHSSLETDHNETELLKHFEEFAEVSGSSTFLSLFVF